MNLNNTTATKRDTNHYDQSLSSTSRPITPTNLFDFELGDDPASSRDSGSYPNSQAKLEPIPNFENNDFDIGVWTAL